MEPGSENYKKKDKPKDSKDSHCQVRFTGTSIFSSMQQEANNIRMNLSKKGSSIGLKCLKYLQLAVPIYRSLLM